ncbi:MAG TPA: GreA/GreB family elongation factor [Rhodothermales bacterium]|nr:GreA/GreB family elongation factor [Rhodothermales bacterium]
MSRAFVKEDAAEAPLIPPRPPLPPGTANYVTPRGLALLRAERDALEAERGGIDADRSDDAERTRRLALNAGLLADLNARLSTAKVVTHASPPPKEVRFGATVTLRVEAAGRPDEERTLTIVGVDEANAANGCLTFTSPIARAITGKRPGERVPLRTARGDETLEILTVSYE